MKFKELFNEDLTPNWETFEKTFPEMTTCEHSKRWHKCGSPLNHTKLVTYEMQKKLEGQEKNEHYFIMMCAAMLHDIGKPSTTYWDENKKDWCCKSHGEAGERLLRNTFKKENMLLREKVAYMVRYHMLLHYTPKQPKERQRRDFNTLLNGFMSFEDMLILNECDMRGSINEDNNEENISNHISSLKELYKEYFPMNKWKYVDSRTSKMYVMIGVPGSGKSTYAKNIQENEKIKGAFEMPIISRDVVRIELGICAEGEKCLGNKKQENMITTIIEEKIKTWASMGVSFIVDNTSLKRKYRELYLKYIEPYDVAPVYIYVEAPSLEENFKRREGQVDNAIIQGMWDSMDFPSRDECYEMILVDQNNDNEFKI